MNKDLTPYKLALITSFSISILSAFLIVLKSLFSEQNIDYLFVLIFFCIIFLVSYASIRFFLERFIYSRIKPIYKIIQPDTNPKEKISGAEFSSDLIQNLDSEVTKWKDKTEKEIVTLKILEEYRKTYVGNISHELKTPLFSIQGYIHTLLEDVEDPKIQRKFLLRAAANTDRLLTIVNDLETITKLEAGAMNLNFEKFSINKLLNEIFSDLEIQAASRSIQFVKGEGFANEYVVLADKEAVYKILSNLIINSIKYGNENGKTTVNFYELGDNILIEVVDTGIGIEEKHLKHVFDRFYRTDQSRNRGVGGSGLGLSIVKHLVEAHNQRISVKSQIDKGTTFSFTLKKAK